MDTSTQHVISLLRSLADDIEYGRAVYFEVKTDAGARQNYPIGLTAEQREFQRFEMNIEINPHAPKRCRECRNALVGNKCATPECPVDAPDPGPFMWAGSGGERWHALPCGGRVVEGAGGMGHLRCSKCGQDNR